MSDWRAIAVAGAVKLAGVYERGPHRGSRIRDTGIDPSLRAAERLGATDMA